MNWRTGVRIVLAAIGLGVAALVFVKSRNGPPSPALPPGPAKLDPDQRLLGGPGNWLTNDSQGKPALKVTFKGSRAYDDGRMRFDDAVVDGLGDSKFTLHAGVLETKGTAGQTPTQFALSGHFTFESSDGMVVESDQGTYDDTTGVLSIPGALTFHRSRLSGTGNGAVYERDKDTTTILDSATATVAPDEQGRGSAQATSKRMLLMRGQHSVLMEENARIAGETQVLTSRNATVLFTDDESAMKFLELRGAARVAPVAGAAPGQPAMSADGLTMSFHPDGITIQHATLTGNAVMTTTDAAGTRSIKASWIDFVTAPDGHTLTQLNARDRVLVEIPATATSTARAITSAVLNATGDEKRGLTSARFEGSPCFQEGTAVGQRGRPSQPLEENPCSAAARAASRKAASPDAPSRRFGTATVLVMKLGGQIDSIQQAEFQQNAIFEDGRVSASADIATYDDAEDVLYLKPNQREPRRQSGVKTSDMTVDANEIDVYLESENLKARGGVRTRTVRTPEKSKNSAGSLFEGEDPVYGTADTLDYVRETGKATYVGSMRAPARVTQAKTDISAVRIEFTESTSNLLGFGQVDSKIFMTAPSSGPKTPAKPQTYNVKSETLAYDDARRIAVYEAPLVTLTTEDGNRTESRKLTFELAKDSRTLDRMRAEGSGSGVFATLSGGYEAKGDLLVYVADTEIYSITGKPAVVKSAPDKDGHCKRTESTNVEVNRKTGSVDIPGRNQAPSQTTAMSCSESIRSIKK